MPILPKDDDVEGVRTRHQRQQEIDGRRFGGTPSQEPGRVPQPEMESAAGSSAESSTVARSPASFDFAALMAMMEEQARRQEEQARRQEEHLHQLEADQARRQEEQARRQEEQARRQEEQARRQEEQLRQLEADQARRQEEQAHLLKELHVTIGKDLKEVKEQVKHHESRISEAETQIADVKKALGVLKSGDGNVAPSISSTSVRGFKVPPFDGSSSWSAYKIQLDAVVEANGWTKKQAMTALTLGLRDQALTILEALGKEVSYEQLLEALESRYGDAHLEHVFRAQLKDRSQRSTENLQQWALEIEKLVRKAYQSSPALIHGNLVQAFIDGIRDLEVRATVRLGHHESLKNALAHALEVEAVRQDHRAHRVREVVTSSSSDRFSRPKFSPRCYECGEKGHLRSSCPKRTTRGEDRPQGEQGASASAQHQQGNE